MANAGRELGLLSGGESWIDSSVLRIRSVDGEKKRIKKRVSRKPRIRLAIFEIAPQFATDLQVVLSMGNGDHVVVTVDILPGALWITHIRPEPLSAIIKDDARYAWQWNCNHAVVLRISCPKLV